MKQGFEINGKMLNIDMLLEIAKKNKLTPEQASVKMGMGKMYLRNRKNENKIGVFRTAQSDIVERAMETFGVSYESLLLDLPTRR